MSEQQFKQYNNIILFAEKWRGYTPDDFKKHTTQESFRKEMQSNKYVILEYLSKQGRKVLIYLFAPDSKHASASQDLKKLIGKNKNPCDIILITEQEFKTYANRVINAFLHLNIRAYLHRHFNSDIPNGPNCYPHRIMSHIEVNQLLNNELFCHLIHLPKILEEDPQCIWLGAQVADVIEVRMLSDSTGETIQYKVVIRKDGKMNLKKKETEEDEKEKETEDDDIKEYRETAIDDISDASDVSEDEEEVELPDE